MKFQWKLWATAVAFMALAACTSSNPYVETFDEPGAWPQEENPYAIGRVFEGGYELEVKASDGLFWATNGVSTGDGTYQVEATQLAGPLDNGYGLLFMADPAEGNFFLFEVSGDGFVQIARCRGSCETEQEILVGTFWEESAAVLQGINQTNVLRVTADEGNMTFWVNEQEVGRAYDVTFTQGEIGVLVETLGAGDVKVRFDNYRYTPLP